MTTLATMKALNASTLRTLLRPYSSSLRVTEQASLILFFVSLFGGCEAQNSPDYGIIPIAIFVGLGGVCTITCVCIACCAACNCCSNCKKMFRSGSIPHIGSYTYNHQYQPSSTLPSRPNGVESMSIKQSSELVSLPEATLHQGDAPPAYEEAIGMKTIDIPK